MIFSLRSPQAAKFFLIWNICSFIIIIVTILACAGKNGSLQSASFVFSEFQNYTGFNKSYTAILGLLQTGKRSYMGRYSPKTSD